MSGAKAGHNDLVSSWLEANDLKAPALTQELCFEFSPARLVVSSNNKIFIKKISRRLCHYLGKLSEQGLNGKETLKAEIFTFGESLKKGINLPPCWNGIHIDLTSPKGFQVIKTEYFYHLKMGQQEAIWRPHDLLVSFSPVKERFIKFLIAETSQSVTLFQKKGALERKGPIDWEEISDMVLMIFMRLLDFFCLHAATLIIEDRGVILTGSSGSGKTTSALALLKNGATLLSDELTLLSTKDVQQPMVSGILVDPRFFDSQASNIFYFDVSGPRKNNWEKKSAPLPDKIVQKGIFKTVKPAMILFLDLRENNQPDHLFHKIDKLDALTNLVSQVLDPFNSTRHQDIFETVFRLVDQCSLFRLELGRNVDRLSKCISNLL